MEAVDIIMAVDANSVTVVPIKYLSCRTCGSILTLSVQAMCLKQKPPKQTRGKKHQKSLSGAEFSLPSTSTVPLQMKFNSSERQGVFKASKFMY